MTKKVVCVALWMGCAYAVGVQSQKLAAAEGSRTEIDNDRVVVRRNIRSPHSVTPMHSHRAGVVVYLTDVRERSTAPDGTSKIVTHKAGEVVWAGPRQHALENLGDAPIEAIEVELK